MVNIDEQQFALIGLSLMVGVIFLSILKSIFSYAVLSQTVQNLKSEVKQLSNELQSVKQDLGCKHSLPSNLFLTLVSQDIHNLKEDVATLAGYITDNSNMIQYVKNIADSKLTGSMLVDGEIKEEIRKGNILIEPFEENWVGPNSIDLHLGPMISWYALEHDEDGSCYALDSKKHNEITGIEIPQDGFMLEPGRLYLATTLERTEAKGFIAMIEGCSSTGRLGLSVHQTAPLSQAGFSGAFVLELSSVHPLVIYPGMKIAQLFYFPINTKKLIEPYNKKKTAKYTNQGHKPVESKTFEDFIPR